MESYTSFAAVYDMFMDNIPYEEWASYVISLLRRRGLTTAWFWIWDAEPEA